MRRYKVYGSRHTCFTTARSVAFVDGLFDLFSTYTEEVFSLLSEEATLHGILYIIFVYYIIYQNSL